jgi:hypothetical protein
MQGGAIDNGKDRVQFKVTQGQAPDADLTSEERYALENHMMVTDYTTNKTRIVPDNYQPTAARQEVDGSTV